MWKEKTPNKDKYVQSMQAVPGRSPIAVKNVTSPFGDMISFSGKKENQSNSVINNFFLEHLKNWI